MTSLPVDRRPTLREIAAPGIAAIKANWRPFVLLQAAAAAFVASFYLFEPVGAALEQLGRWRSAGGYVVAGLLAAVAGAIVPEIAKAITQAGWHLRGRWEQIGFLLVLYFLNGMAVDGWYRLLGVWFGNDVNVPTVAAKVVADMGGFTPLIALPLIVLAFGWRRHGYSASKLYRRELAPSPLGFFARRVGVLLLPDWFFWVPMVCLIYSLPGELQVVLFAFAMAAWSLLMVFIGEDPADADSEDVEPVPPPT